MKSSRASGGGHHQMKKLKKNDPKSSYGYKVEYPDDYDFQNNEKRVHIEFQANLTLKDDFDLEDWK